jgi:hypothetical protein
MELLVVCHGSLFLACQPIFLCLVAQRSDPGDDVPCSNYTILLQKSVSNPDGHCNGRQFQ